MAAAREMELANEAIAKAAGDFVEAVVDALSHGLWTVGKIIVSLGKARGHAAFALRLHVAEAYAKSKGISTEEAFMELDQRGVFEDYD